MATVTVKLFQIRRSYTAGYRPPTTGTTALKAGETLRNYADKVDLHGVGDGTWLETPIGDSIIANQPLVRSEIPNKKIAVKSFRTAGYTTAGDGGGAPYIAGTSAGPGAIQDANGKYWILDVSGGVSPEWFGADPTGVTDATAAWQAALNTGRAIYARGTKYKLLGQVTSTNKDVLIIGAGRNLTKILCSGSSAAGFVITNTDTTAKFSRQTIMRDFTFSTDQVGVHTPVTITHNPVRLIIDPKILLDVDWTVENRAKSAGQYFYRFASLTNTSEVEVRSPNGVGSNEVTAGGGFDLFGLTISFAITGKHNFQYGDTLIRCAWLEASSLTIGGVTGTNPDGYGAQPYPFGLLKGRTSGAQGRWMRFDGDRVYVSNDNGIAYLEGEQLDDETYLATAGASGTTCNITGVYAAAFPVEGIFLGDGEVVGYASRLISQVPTHVAQDCVTFSINGHANTSGTDISLNYAQDIKISGEILSYLGATGKTKMNFDSCTGASIDAVMAYPISGDTGIKLADCHSFNVSASANGAWPGGLVQFANANIFGSNFVKCTGHGTRFSGQAANLPFRRGDTADFNQTVNTVSGATIQAGGTGYYVNQLLTVVNGKPDAGGGNTAILKVTSVGGGGAITGVTVLRAGSYVFTAANPVSVKTAPFKTGSGATFNLTYGTATAARYGNQLGARFGAQLTFDPPSLAAGSGTNVYADITVAGVQKGDPVVAYTDVDLGLVNVVPVARTGVIRVHYANYSNAAIDPPVHIVTAQALR